MKASNLLDMIGDTDDTIIKEAKERKKNVTLRWNKWIAIVACFCVAVVGIVSIICTSNTKVTVESIKDTSINNTDGVYIPAVELPEKTDAVEMDMIAFVVYKGSIYTQAESYYKEDADKIDELVGSYLGYATGSINEWSTQDEYTKEFASSVEGEVYEVKGYDKDFRICVRSEYENEAGEKYLSIQFLDHLNDITLKTGQDLFESRLHIADRVIDIQYQNHDDWDYGKDNIRNADIDSQLWKEFVNQVNNADLIYTWDSSKSSDTIYDNQNQAHILLTMNDGTVISLRLIEGGYVGYDPLGWYFVKIPGDTFDAIFSACGGSVK